MSPFHAMNVVPGECLEPILQAPPPAVLPLVPARAFAAAAMLAALHRVDPDVVGLGAEKRTEWVLEQLYSIVNERWQNERSIVVTSNLRLDELSKDHRLHTRHWRRLRNLRGERGWR